MQDTLLAAKALTEFALRETNRLFYNIELTLEAVSDKNWHHKVYLNRTNYFTIQRFLVRNVKYANNYYVQWLVAV